MTIYELTEGGIRQVKDDKVLKSTELDRRIKRVKPDLLALDTVNFKPNKNQLALSGIIAWILHRGMYLGNKGCNRVIMQVPPG